MPRFQAHREVTDRAAPWRSLVDGVRHMHPVDRRALLYAAATGAAGAAALAGLLAAIARSLP